MSKTNASFSANNSSSQPSRGQLLRGRLLLGLTFILIASLSLSGCSLGNRRQSLEQNILPEFSGDISYENASVEEIEEEEALTAPLSEKTDLETIEAELQQFDILEEDFSDL